MALSRPQPPWEIPQSALIVGDTKLGNGHYSHVYLAKLHQENGEDIEVAAKLLPKQHATQTQSEIDILHKLSQFPHPNIIKFYGAAVSTVSITIVTEIAKHGSLHDYLREQKRLGKRLPPERIDEWALQMARAIQHLHKHKVMHRDIKSPNFLVMEDMTLKLCDFGISEPDTCTKTTSTRRGSLRWMAPELYGDDKVSSKSDIFSLGAVIWEMIMCEEPYHQYQKELKLMNAVMNNKEELEIPVGCPEYLKNLITRCRQFDRDARPTIEEILEILRRHQNGDTGGNNPDQVDAEGDVSDPVDSTMKSEIGLRKPTQVSSANDASDPVDDMKSQMDLTSLPTPTQVNTHSGTGSIAPLKSATRTSMEETPQFFSYNNWVKASEGMVECVGHAAAMIVTQVIGQWHKDETEGRGVDLKCPGYPTCNPQLKNDTPNRPKAGRGYCNQCVKWGQEVIPSILAKSAPPFDIYWQHIKSSDYYGSAIQVAKLFGLKKIPAEDLAAITDFELFDCAWLLSIMEKVNLFHKGDTQQQIQTITKDRNNIMHRPIAKKMTDPEMHKYLDSQAKLIECFRQHFPEIISESDAINMQGKLNQIRNMSKVTPAMVQRTVLEFMKLVESWQAEWKAIDEETLNDIVNICKDYPDLQTKIREAQVELEIRLTRVENDVETMKEQYSSLVNQQQSSVEHGSHSSSMPIPCSDSTRSSHVDDESKQQSGYNNIYDILLVHCEKDMDSAMYKDLDNFFRKEQLSVISMHELLGGGDVFSKYYKALEYCNYTMCLLTKQFLKDPWCDKLYIQACDREVRKREASVLYVKEAGFNDDDVPAGLMGTSGIDHDSKFFRSSLRNTFQDLPRRRMERHGNCGNIPQSNIGNTPQSNPGNTLQNPGNTPQSNTGNTLSSNQQNNESGQTQIQIDGRYNVVIPGAIVNSTINIVMPPQDPMRQTPTEYNPSQHREPSIDPAEHLPMDYNPQQPNESTTHPPMQDNTEQSHTYMHSRNTRASDTSSATSYMKLPNTLQPPSNTAAANDFIDPYNTPPIHQTKFQSGSDYSSPSLVSDSSSFKYPIRRGKFQSVSGYDTPSMDSVLSSIKKSMSSPDLLSIGITAADDDDVTDDDLAASLVSTRLSSTSSEFAPFPFVGYSESFNPIYSNKDQTARGATGLKNLGNTCFMNTAIQCLSSATLLVKYFIGGGYNCIRANHEERTGKVAEEFAKVVYALWCGKYQSISPRDLHDAVCNNLPMFSGDPYNRHGQHDVQEFLASLIEEGLHKELNPADQTDAKPSSEPPQDTGAEQMSMLRWQDHIHRNQSIIVDLFQGQLRSVVHCNECQHDSSTFDVFTFLTLPIPAGKDKVQLQDCFDEFSKEEKLEGDNAYHCEHCKKPCNATKRIDVWKLPQILLICLKRFSWNVVGGNSWQDKDCRMVQFPVTDFEVNSANPSGEGYNLFAVANHIGGVTDGGHYTAYCLNAINKQWYDFNDNIVTEIDASDTQTAKAYVLFYSCVNLSPPV